MSTRTLTIAFNGATGDLARRHHLPGLVAMRAEGGLPLANGDRVVPEVVLVGRSADKLEAAAAETGFSRTSTDLAAVLREPDVDMVFDAGPSGLRVGIVRQAIGFST